MRPTALVTGASRGIGRAIALRLARSYDVIAAARSEGELRAVVAEAERSGGAARALRLDVTDRRAVAAALSGERVDVLVNNAGVATMKPLVELAPEEWQAMIDTNLSALYHVTRAVLPGMLERGRGHVIVIGSLAGRNPLQGGTGYTATKHAVIGFCESLMLEVRDRGVKVSTVMPGSVATEFSRGGSRASWKLTPDDVALVVERILSTPENMLVSRVELRPLKPERRG